MNRYCNTVLLMALSLSYTTTANATSSIEDKPIHVLVYETNDETATSNLANSLKGQIERKVHGVDVEYFGRGEEFVGFGSKFTAVLPLLQRLDDDALVVLADSRDVLLNNPYNDDLYATILSDEFKQSYEELTFEYPGAIVISAEAQCCVSALTHATPGAYFNTDGSRYERACSSGEAHCLWNGDDKAVPWETFMKDLMLTRTAHEGSSYDDMYLNAGLIAGKVKDLLRVIHAAQIGGTEDDQAVLTDYMYRYPNQIVLDYQQKMFGNNRAGVAGIIKADRCTFQMSLEQKRLIHKQTKTAPLFIHSPGGFYECHDNLSELLGIPLASKTERNLLRADRSLTKNYGKLSDALLDKDHDQNEHDGHEDDTSTNLTSILTGLRQTPVKPPSCAPASQSSSGLFNALQSRENDRN